MRSGLLRDDGAAIERGVERVSPAQTADGPVAIRRDIECSVPARAVACHIERRVPMNGNKTVVFS